MSDSASVPVIGTKRKRLAVSGAWKKNEDELLLKAMAEAPKNWKHAEGIVGRTAKQCRDRYRLTLDPSINHGPWDRVEEERLLQYHKVYGNKWSKISLHLPGRTEGSVKACYIRMQRKIRKASKKRWTTEKSWTTEEDKMVLDFLEMPDKAKLHCLAAKLGRTESSVKKRRAYLEMGRCWLLCNMLRINAGSFADEKAAAPAHGTTAHDATAHELKGTDAHVKMLRSAPSSRFRGVSFDKKTRKWKVKITHGGRVNYLGDFADEKEAALAYDAKARELKGEGAVTNFDDVTAAAAVAAKRASSRVQSSAAVSSQFRGVHFESGRQKWRATVRHSGRCKHIGYFTDEKAAALAYDAKARELNGEGAVTNFDDVAAAAVTSAKRASSRRVQSSAAVSSSFLGVSFNSASQKWRAQITHGGRVNYLGEFTDEKEAALAYSAKARELKGEGADTNFNEAAAAATATATVSSRRAQRSGAGSSRFRGVSFNSQRQKWMAYISHGGRQKNLGSFADEKEAALAYDAKSRELNEEGAVTNFDDVAAATAVAAKRASSRHLQCSAAVSSQFRGVYFDKGRQTWRATIRDSGRRNYLGSFADEKEAALAYDAKARELYGEDAVTNFDDVAAANAVASTKRASSRRVQRSAAVSTSPFRGVSFNSASQKWRAQITHGGKVNYLGEFTDEKEAALVYDAKARELYGEDAVTNFDDVAAANAVASTKRASSRRVQRSAAVSTSPFRGVSFNSASQKWRAQITHGGRVNYLGEFTDEKEAALVYDAKARELNGEGAVTNFDDVAAANAVASAKRASSRRVQSSAAVSSPFLGVSFNSGSQKWKVQITHGGRVNYLGEFTDEKEAALAYDAMARELKGEGAVTNFGTVTAAVRLLLEPITI